MIKQAISSFLFILFLCPLSAIADEYVEYDGYWAAKYAEENYDKPYGSKNPFPDFNNVVDGGNCTNFVKIGTCFLSTKLHRAFQLFPVRPRPSSAATCCGGGRARADGWPSSRKENGKDCRWIENGLWKFGERPENMENVLFRAAVRRRSRISIFFGGARRDSIPIIVLRDLRVRIVVDEF